MIRRRVRTAISAAAAVADLQTRPGRPLDTSEEVTRAFEKFRVPDLPVADRERGFLGAIMHDDLARVGQDPATSSSIVLSTVTTIAGLFSFLGIATPFFGFL